MTAKVAPIGENFVISHVSPDQTVIDTVVYRHEYEDWLQMEKRNREYQNRLDQIERDIYLKVLGIR